MSRSLTTLWKKKKKVMRKKSEVNPRTLGGVLGRRPSAGFYEKFERLEAGQIPEFDRIFEKSSVQGLMLLRRAIDGPDDAIEGRAKKICKGPSSSGNIASAGGRMCALTFAELSDAVFRDQESNTIKKNLHRRKRELLGGLLYKNIREFGRRKKGVDY